MTYYDEIYMKLREIKFNCELQSDCGNCPYSKGVYKHCRLSGAPFDWNLEDMEEQDGEEY